jgi:hypothetical protein
METTCGLKEMQTWFTFVRGEGKLVVKPEQAYMMTCTFEAIYRSALSDDGVHMG